MSDGLETKNKPKNRMTAIAIIAIIVIAATIVVAWQLSIKQPTAIQSTAKQNSATVLPPMNLTVIGANGTELFLNQTSIAKFTSYSGYGGLVNKTGQVESFGYYTGVPILTLLNLVGGINSSQEVNVTCRDGYSTVFTYQQVYGQGYAAYNNVTGSLVSSTAPFNVVLAYFYNGSVLPSGDGPLKIVLLGTGTSEGLLTKGKFWCKMVDTIEVT